MAQPKLPRLRRGDLIKAEHWNALCDAIERATISATFGIELKQGPFGTSLGVLPLPPTLIIGSVTTTITKATSATRPGKGAFKRYTTIDLTTTPATLGGLTATAEDVYSINTEKQVNSGTILVSKRLGVWWVDQVAGCANLS